MLRFEFQITKQLRRRCSSSSSSSTSNGGGGSSSSSIATEEFWGLTILHPQAFLCAL